MQQSNATHDRRAIISSSRSNPCLFFYGNYDYRGAMLREFRTMKAKTRWRDYIRNNCTTWNLILIAFVVFEFLLRKTKSYNNSIFHESNVLCYRTLRNSHYSN